MSTLDADSAAVTPTRPTPVSARERIAELDVLRGIALLGVVVANVWLWFSGAYYLFPEYHAQVARLSVDAVVFNGIGVMVSGKAATTFAFLFGVGFAVQLRRAEARGTAGVDLYRRRLAVLLLFGLVHAFFLWYGDILAAYALVGFVLLFFRGRTDRTLLVWAGLLLVAVPLVMGSIPLLSSLFGRDMPPPDLAPMAELRATSLAAFQSGDPARVFAANLQGLATSYASPKAFWLVMVLGVFLLGLYAGRRRYFENVVEHGPGFRRLAYWGLGLGLPCSVGVGAVYVTHPPEAMATRPGIALLMTVLVTFGTLPLAFGYIATATLLVQRPRWRRILGHFAPVGRMALTNYLSQTVICLLIFYGYGAGLIGQVGATAALVIALLIFAIQMAWSPWWLTRFHFGPAEWLWRTLTYGQVQPLRIREPVALPLQPQVPG
jgi:uncharacterized protein